MVADDHRVTAPPHSFCPAWLLKAPVNSAAGAGPNSCEFVRGETVSPACPKPLSVSSSLGTLKPMRAPVVSVKTYCGSIRSCGSSVNSRASVPLALVLALTTAPLAAVPPTPSPNGWPIDSMPALTTVWPR